jgi:hypothetical protein
MFGINVVFAMQHNDENDLDQKIRERFPSLPCRSEQPSVNTD